LKEDKKICPIPLERNKDTCSLTPERNTASLSLKEALICVVKLATSSTATFPVRIEKKEQPALYDSGADRSVINYSYFLTLKNPLIDTSNEIRVTDANGTSLQPRRTCLVSFLMGTQEFTQEFIIC